MAEKSKTVETVETVETLNEEQAVIDEAISEAIADEEKAQDESFAYPTKSSKSYNAQKARILKYTDGFSSESVDALKELLKAVGAMERKQTVFIARVLSDVAKYLENNERGMAIVALITAHKIISSQLFRGVKGKTLAVLSEHAGITFDTKGDPNECLDKSKIACLGKHLEKQGIKLNMIKTTAMEKPAPKFDAWAEATKFLAKLSIMSKSKDAPDEFKRLCETIAGTLDTLSVKLENKSLATKS